MSQLGTIKLNGKVYGYEASFDEVSGRWYGEVSNQQGKTIHTTKPVYADYQAAILATHIWIKNDRK